MQLHKALHAFKILPNHNKELQQLMVLHTSRHFKPLKTNKHNITKELAQSDAT